MLCQIVVGPPTFRSKCAQSKAQRLEIRRSVGKIGHAPSSTRVSVPYSMASHFIVESHTMHGGRRLRGSDRGKGLCVPTMSRLREMCPWDQRRRACLLDILGSPLHHWHFIAHCKSHEVPAVLTHHDGNCASSGRSRLAVKTGSTAQVFHALWHCGLQTWLACETKTSARCSW